MIGPSCLLKVFNLAPFLCSFRKFDVDIDICSPGPWLSHRKHNNDNRMSRRTGFYKFFARNAPIVGVSLFVDFYNEVVPLFPHDGDLLGRLLDNILRIREPFQQAWCNDRRQQEKWSLHT